MRPPAMLRFGVIACAFIACWNDKHGGSTIDNHTSEPLAMRDLSGGYWCSIESSGYTYDPMPCAIRKVDRGFVLAKLAGSQRFKGQVTPLASGFTFTGEFYCPWGDCTQPLHGTFRPIANGTLFGRFKDSEIVVRMVPAPDAAFGGVAYGGDGYGGFGQFGGGDYGGATYGQPNRNGRRNP